MGKEIEVKIFGIDVDAVRAKLTASGAELVYHGPLRTTHFDFPDGRISNAGGYLRVRSYPDGKGTFTHKGTNLSSLVANREETETAVKNAAALEGILSTIGLVPILKHTKHRESYHLGAVTYDLDTYPGLAPFIEVEAPTENDVIAGVRFIGYHMEQTSSGTIFDYLQTKGIDPASVGIQIMKPTQTTEQTR